MATADWKVASRDRDTGRQLMDRSAIKNSCRYITVHLSPQQKNMRPAPSAHLGCPLSATRKCIEEADTGRSHQEQGEDDVVHRGEVHLDHVCHDDSLVVGSGALWHELVHRPRSNDNQQR